MKKPYKTALCFGGAGMLAVVMVLMSFSLIRQSEEDAAWQKHTFVVLDLAEEILSAIKDTETGQRGYLLTDDENFLGPYLTAVDTLSGQLAQLRRLTQDNPVQQHRLDVLTRLIDANLAELQQTIALHRSQDTAGALKILRNGEGRKLMDAIRVEMNDFIKLEDGLLVQREEKFNATQQQFLLLISALSVFVVMLTFASAYLFYRASRRRMRTQEDKNAILEQSVQQRTRELLNTQAALECDIAERERIEVIARRDKEMLDEAQKLAHLGSWDLDLIENRLAWSVESFHIFEVDPACEDVSYETFISLVHPDDREFVNHSYTTSVKGKTDYDIIHRLLFPDGRLKWVHERCHTFYDADGKPLRSIGTTQDITEFHQEKEARTRFATILAETPDAVGMTDGAGNFLYLNHAGRQMLEIGDTEDVGSCNFVDYHQEWAGKIVRDEGMPTALTQGTWSGETALKSRSGKEIPVLQIIMVHKNKEGGIEFFSTVMRDITVRKAMEAELRSYNVELENINRQLQDTQAYLLQSEKMASIGQLAAGVAHEINNPIGFVYSNFGSLEQYLKDIFEVLDVYERAEDTMHETSLADVRRYKQQKELAFLRQDLPALIAESKDGLTRVKKIVQNLKEFSHAGESDEWQRVNLHLGLDSTLGIVWNEIKYHAQVNKEYGDLPDVECLPSELNQVFMNLLVNAAHAIESAGVITIRTGTLGEEVFVQVIDTGCGISPANLKRIFDPFFTTKPVGKGTGLGLSLSFGIVKKHHGRIDVQSDVGRGTTFTLWLPFKHRVREES